MARERVERVSAKVLAFWAKVLRRVFLMLMGRLVELTIDVKEGYAGWEQQSLN